MAPDFFDHDLQLRGLESYKQFETVFIKGFPDYHETIEDMIAEWDKVWVHFKVTGTHTGEWGLASLILGKPLSIFLSASLGVEASQASRR